MNAHSRSVALIGVVSLAAHAGAATQPTTPLDKPMPAHAPAPPATASRPGASPGVTLRGPTVHTGDAGVASLVAHAFDGRLVRLDVDPGEAALELLSLDDDARQRALAILDKRSGILDEIVQNNLEKLTQIQTAASSGQVFRVVQLASDLHKQFVDRAGDTPLVDQLAGVLPSHDAQRLRDMVSEYWTALVADEAGAKPGRIEAFIIRRRAALEAFGKEIERATQRVTMDATSGSDRWDRMLGALRLSPDQEQEIRAMGREFYLGAHLHPTKEDTADFLIRVYHKLDDQQRETFFRLVITAG